jgi:hypothetical protein
MVEVLQRAAEIQIPAVLVVVDKVPELLAHLALQTKVMLVALVEMMPTHLMLVAQVVVALVEWGVMVLHLLVEMVALGFLHLSQDHR